MTLYDFVLLEEPQQAEAVWQGEFRTIREEEERTVMLYQVHGFYVEVYYCKRTNNITRFNPFQSKSRLQLYFWPCLN